MLRREGGTGALEHRRNLLHDPLIGALHLETLATVSEELLSAEVIARAESGLAGWCAGEIFRAQGETILKEDASDASGSAEALFRRSLDTARRQSALSWELRAAMSLARLWRDQGRIREAHDLLAPVYDRFTEGFDTADLMTARTLLEQLGP